MLQCQIDAATNADGSIDVERLIGLVDAAYSAIDGPDGHADVADWRKMAQKLKASERRFRDLVEAASDWFWETDALHRLTFISPHIAQILGVKSSALLGTTFDDQGLECDPETARIHAADLAARAPFRDRIFHAGPAEGVDSRMLRISGMPFFDDEGTFLGYRGIGIDITREIAAKQQAGEARQILADAMESLFDGVAVFDVDDGLVIYNHRFSEVFGQDKQTNRIGMSFEELVRSYEESYVLEDPDFEKWIQFRVRRHREATGEPLVIETKQGKWLLARECRMANGGVVSVRTDITEIKRQQNELATLKRHYQIILDSAGEGIIGLDSNGDIIFANRTACSFLKYGSDELLGQSFRSLIQSRTGEGKVTKNDEFYIAQSYQLGLSQHVTDQTFRKGDGTSFPVDYFCGPLMDGERITGAVLAFRDATLRLQYEKAVEGAQRELERLVAERTQELSREVVIRTRTEMALRESRTRMKGITDCLLEGVLVVSITGDVVFTNPAARTLLCPANHDELEGLPVDELVKLGANHPSLDNSSVDTLLCFADGPWQKVAAGNTMVRENDALFVTDDGRKLSVAYACSSLDVEGCPPACVVLFRDIQELKHAQWDAMQASRMASVGQLAAGIAHEINTPTQYIGDNLRFVAESVDELAEIITHAKSVVEQIGGETAQTFQEICAKHDLDYLLEEVPNALQQSEDGVKQVSRIVLSMKEFSHPGSTSRISTNINRALESTLTVSRNTWKHVAELALDLDPDLPLAMCFAGELNQVFLNLIVNAAHAIQEMHQNHLGVISVATAREGDYVRISIGDTGPGVPASIRDKIFDPFFTTKPVGKGTGQGLAICRDVVVTKHKGRLDLEKKEGMGAVFVIRIPIEAPDEFSPNPDPFNPDEPNREKLNAELGGGGP